MTMETIGVNQLKMRIPELPLLDVRDVEAYRSEHIPGARNAPLDVLEARARDLLEAGAEVVVYCDDPDGALSAEAGRRLEGLGHFGVMRLEGGLEAWRLAGFPTAP